jgi:tetratricopeptide (TPR) repeat protein
MTAAPDQGPDREAAAARLRAVGEAIRAQDMGRAIALAVAALAAGDEHPAFLNLRALQHEEAGRFDQALADLEAAERLSPGDFTLPNAQGLTLARMNRNHEAIAAFDRALALNPDFAPAWFNRGCALEPVGELVAARAAYERALQIDPHHPEAAAHLARLATRRADFASARTLAEQALALRPGQPTAELSLAAADLGEGAAALAVTRLRTLLARADIGPLDRALAEGQLGDALDAARDYPQAFTAYAASSASLLRLNAARFTGPGVSDMLRWIDDYFAGASKGAWVSHAQSAPPLEEARALVFLTGFPRSGTTLMEQVLAAHPDAAALEERETLVSALRAYLRNSATLDNLARAGEDELAAHRRAYWDVVRGAGVDPTGKVFIDKNPFNTSKLPLVAKLFPQAKVLFALRDPRDVVFSCFRRRFGMNGSTFEFLTLDGAARAYDLTMRLRERFHGLLGLAWHDLSYEQMVADFEGERRKVFEFVGLDPDAVVADATLSARRGAVATASGAQVGRAVYGEGVGQWRRYAVEMSPVAEILSPWIARFGYEA